LAIQKEDFEQVETEEEAEEEAEECGGYDYPVREVEVTVGVDESGGNIHVRVRFDGLEPEEVIGHTLRLYKEVNGHYTSKRKEHSREVV